MAPMIDQGQRFAVMTTSSTGSAMHRHTGPDAADHTAGTCHNRASRIEFVFGILQGPGFALEVFYPGPAGADQIDTVFRILQGRGYLTPYPV